MEKNTPVKELIDLATSFGKVLHLWENSDSDIVDSILTTGYPFDESFDELYGEVIEWVQENVGMDVWIEHYEDFDSETSDVSTPSECVQNLVNKFVALNKEYRRLKIDSSKTTEYPFSDTMSNLLEWVVDWGVDVTRLSDVETQKFTVEILCPNLPEGTKLHSSTVYKALTESLKDCHIDVKEVK